MHVKEMEKWLKKNLGKVGVDLGADKNYDTTLNGENEMGIKDDLGMDKTFEELLAKPEEEYVWVKGFKGTEKDMSCKGYQYELGKQFDLDEDSEPSVCHNGFHFCKELSSVFGYYNIGYGNRFFEVEALVKKSDLDPKNKDYAKYANVPWSLYRTSSDYDDKYAAKSIQFIRELTVDEVFETVTDSDVREWAEEQKKRAMETSISAVRKEVREFELCAAGYSPAFSKYIAGDTGRYKTAMAMASLPNVSMDIKVMAIFMDNQEVNMEVN